jgi:hypothetical protein
MAGLTRRAALAAFGAFGALGVGSALGLRYVLRDVSASPMGCMGGGMADMRLYMDMFARHTEITRTVEEIPGGVRTTTQSDSPDLAAQLHSHVSSMYSHLDKGVEVMCMSQTLPTLFRKAHGYRRQLTITPTGVIAEEIADDPALTETIRAHAREVTGFVRDGMPAMMQGMMGCGGMLRPDGP